MSGFRTFHPISFLIVTWACMTPESNIPNTSIIAASDIGVVIWTETSLGLGSVGITVKVKISQLIK